jgi:hypothetical protein
MMMALLVFIAAVALLAALMVSVSVVLLEGDKLAGLGDFHINVCASLGARERLLDRGHLLRC